LSPDPEANLKKTWRRRSAVKAGAQIICTQELFRSQYFCQSEDHKISTRRTNSARAPTLSKSSQKKTGPSSLRRSSRNAAPASITTTAAVIDADGSLLGIYRKMHIPTTAVLRKILFHAGDLGFRRGGRNTQRSAC